MAHGSSLYPHLDRIQFGSGRGKRVHARSMSATYDVRLLSHLLFRLHLSWTGQQIIDLFHGCPTTS